MTEVLWPTVPNGTDTAFLAGQSSPWGNSTWGNGTAVSTAAAASFKCSLTKTGFQFYYLPAVYILVFIIGFLGNSVAIWMFVFHMKPWSGISVYMFNLALADFLYVLTLPALIFYYFNKTDWIFGDVMCKLQRFIFHVNLYGSILFLTCISAHRYSGVVYPLKSLGRLKKKNAVYISVLVWLTVVVGISPILFYSGTGLRTNKTTCYDTTSDEYLRSYFIYSMCTTVAMFCVPLVLILGCYGLIVKALIYNDLDNSPLRRKSIYLVIIVLTVFAVSYIPFHVMKTMNLRARLDIQTPEMCDFNDRVYATYQVTRGLASLNSCVDPILYFLAGDTFRRRLSRATRKASRRSEANLQSKSEDMTLNILSEFKQNGDTSL
ncbi:PREDICTED: P2Y purinoceptor 1-like [Chrysochloris asiatica]|uniref:P2Y purinoceptor 1 n=1 Tax=Chrysochloris asiatica TaxID=185453 RepID=A0A9B0TNI2_CHRAS|nr:PREDICTED: P2Y purinoceptor 1-like [Chrysochloris asiatica]